MVQAPQWQSAEQWEGPASHRRRVPGAVVIVAVVAVAAVVGLLAGGGGQDAGGSFTVETAQRPPDTGPEGPTRLDPLTGRSVGEDGVGVWRSMAASPLAARAGHVTAWTGAELLVWGGAFEAVAFGDGAAYDPVADTWRVLADAPLAPRADATAVWTGDQLVVWGGSDGTSSFADGAAYDPATDSWELLPPAPIAARAAAAGVWTGHEVLVWGADAQLALDGAAYDPTTRMWRPMAPAPLSGASGRGSRMVWIGDRAIAWSLPAPGSADPPAAAYDPATDGWNALPPHPFRGRFDPTLAWDGRRLHAWGILFGPAEQGVGTAAAVYDPAAEEWAEAEQPPLRWRPGALLAPTPDRAVAWVGDTSVNGAVRVGGARWRPIAPSPLSGRLRAAPVWTGDALLLWGGERSSGALDDGAVWQPTSAAPPAPPPDLEPPWTALPPPPIQRRFGATATWTGRQVVVLGGLQRPRPPHLDGAAYDPQRDAWRPVPPASGGSRFGHQAVWTGHELVVLGGQVAGERGPAGVLAYEPEAASWRTLPAAGLDVIAATWTGSVVLVLGRDLGADADRDVRVRALDPVTGSWADLRAPPLRSAAKAVAWTGSEAVVVSARGDEAATLDPRTGTWRPLPAPPVAGSFVQLAATGAHAVVAARVGPGWTTATLDLDSRTWRATGEAPVGTSALVLLPVGDGVVAVGRPGPLIASLDPATGRWRALPDSPLPRRHGAATSVAEGLLVLWGGGTSPDAGGHLGALLDLGS